MNDRWNRDANAFVAGLELDDVRHQLRRIVEARLLGPLDERGQSLYKRLIDRETQLLASIAPAKPTRPRRTR